MLLTCFGQKTKQNKRIEQRWTLYAPVNNLFYARRAEPLLTQIKADRTVVVSPVFDKVNFDDLKVIQYLPAAHAFDWALWCMYESFTPEYYQLNDSSLPGK